jgi:putative membrane protein
VGLLVEWLLSALLLWLVAQIIPGMEVRDFGGALQATVIIALVGLTVGPVLRFIAFPITLLTLGLFRIVINAILLKLASLFSSGFRINGFVPALLGALALAILKVVLHRTGWATL